MAVTETPREYQTPEVPRNPSGVHQPVVICIDTSGSMKDKEDGSKEKFKIVEDMINDLTNMKLSEYDKENVEICVLVFDDDVRTLVDWRSLNDFEGGIVLDDIAGTTSLGSAILESIEKTRERREVYAKTGIRSKRAQIFIYTDGVSTEDMTDAYNRSQEYLNREKPSAKMYITLIPPAADPSQLIDLGTAVTIMVAKECEHGLPAAFEFMQGSIVSASVSAYGETTSTTVPDSIALVGREGGDEKKNSDGTRTVEVGTNTDWTLF